MARPVHPDAMRPSKPGRTRTAPPAAAPKYPMGGGYLSYIVFGGCSLFFVFSSLILLRTVWAIGNGAEAYAAVLEDFENPVYIAYHVLAVLGFLFTGWRFLVQLFGKSQPPRIGPLPSPPPHVFPPLMIGAWLVTSVAVLVVAWGIFP